MPRPPLPFTLAAALAACLTVPLLAGPQEGPGPDDAPAAARQAPLVTTWDAEKFRYFLNHGSGYAERSPSLTIVELRDDRVTLEPSGPQTDPPTRYVVPRDAADFALKEWIKPTVDPAVGLTLEPGAAGKLGAAWVTSFLDGGETEYKSLRFYREADNQVLLTATPRYADYEFRRRVWAYSARQALDLFGLELELGRTYEAGDGSRDVRWGEDELRAFLAGDTPFRSATIEEIGGRNVEFAVQPPAGANDPAADAADDEPAALRRTAAIGTVRKVFGSLDLPREALEAGYRLTPPPKSDDPAASRPEAAADADDDRNADGPDAEFAAVDPAAELPERWVWPRSALEFFLSGGVPEVASLTVTEIVDGGFVPDVGWREGSVTFRAERTGDAAPLLVRTGLDEARRALAGTGLSLQVGGTLRPLENAGDLGAPVPFPTPDVLFTPTESPAGGLGSFGAGGDEYLRALVANAAALNGADRETAVETLKSTLAEQFDAAQTEREGALAALEAKVKRLRSLHDKRAAAKAEIVARRADTLLREADGLGWGAPGGEDRFPRPYSAPGGPEGGGGFGGSGGGFGGGRPDGFVRDLRPEPGQTVPVSGVEVRRDRVVVSFSSGTEDGLETWDRLELLDGDGAVIGRVRLTSTSPDSAQAIAKGDTDAIIEAGRAGTLTARLPLDDTAEKAEFGGGVRLLFFTNDQAEPAEKLRPFVDSLIEEGEPVTVVNTAERPDVMKRHGVTGVPTFVLLVDGEEVFRNVGLTGVGARTVADRIRPQLARAKSRE